ncbi:tetratricopeptide repeat family protein [Isorropodon fossajaponicum endosymbiont JTNG4]|uniref:tetratricopeptide repeat protein n=1 Tax=Isorropodon fossajaponicum symbiont TaxID=883811 RepID=UPI0019156D8F|nr:tetratricopeptide repeat protein [Isorropodon fossajaponicum symbiont]BBB23860.1 tetratricopeptide repeat family protein [Isorropodon fossajaponicum endosymbiont JTNG4]
MNKIQTLLTTTVLLFGISGSGFAGYSEAKKAYNIGDFSTALKEYKIGAQQGDVKAQHNLGIMYGSGKAGSVNNKKAFYWFEKAAINNFAESQRSLAIMYLQGMGVEEDTITGMYWLKKAANNNLMNAQALLGNIYATSKYVKPDAIKSTRWRIKAANQGDLKSQRSVHGAYRFGYGVTVDKVRSIKFLEAAAAQNDKRSIHDLAMIYKSINADQFGLITDYNKAKSLFEKAADLGSEESLGELAGMYIFGIGVDKNMLKAKELIQKTLLSKDVKIQEKAQKKWDDFELWKY